MISTIIFDLGGVLVHLHWDRVLGLMERLSKLEPPHLRGNAVRKEVLNGAIVGLAMRGAIGPGEFHRNLCQALEIDVSHGDFVNVWNQLLSPNQEIAPVIERLKPHYRLVLASNTEPAHFQHTVSICPTLRHFNDRFLSYEMGLLKPEPEFFNYVLRGLGVQPAECLFIDDTQENIDAAAALGINGLLFQNNGQLTQDLANMQLI